MHTADQTRLVSSIANTDCNQNIPSNCRPTSEPGVLVDLGAKPTDEVVVGGSFRRFRLFALCQLSMTGCWRIMVYYETLLAKLMNGKGALRDDFGRDSRLGPF